MVTSIAPKPRSSPARGPNIDRNSFEPPYHQLASLLRQQIASGELRPGDRVPSEAQLCERYEVSPMTVRRAINILLDEGLVTATRGRGTFVRPLVLGTATFGLQALEDLFSDERTSVRFLSVRTSPVTQRISQRLHVPIGEKVISIRRLLSHGSKPVAFHREYLIFDPTQPIVEAEMGITTLQGLFDGQGETVLKRGELTIETTVLTDEEAKLLDAPAGRAAFRIEHIFYDFEDRPVSWGWFIVPGDRLRFNASVGVQRPPTDRTK
jgi:GntR family transcriptional regulator